MNLERRHYGRRQRRIGGDGRIKTPRPKAQCKGSANAAKKWKLHIPSRRWNSQKIFASEQRLRTSALTRDCPERGEEQEILQGKSDELHSPTPIQEVPMRDDEEAKSDFWTKTGEFIYRHHVEPRVKLFVSREESFPIPLKYIDVTSTTYASLDLQGVALYGAFVLFYFFKKKGRFLLRKMVLVPLPCCIIWCPNAFPYKSREHIFLR